MKRLQKETCSSPGIVRVIMPCDPDIKHQDRNLYSTLFVVCPGTVHGSDIENTYLVLPYI